MSKFFEQLKRPFTRAPYHPLQNGRDGKYIFIHINKTGGTSIDKALGLRKRHLSAKEIIDWIGYDEYSAAFKFAVVRNPWSKVVSHYNFRIKNEEEALKERPIDFKDWVIKTYGPEKDLFYYNNPLMFQPQVDWLKNHHEEVDVDEILRFENLNDEFERIREKLGGKKGLPHVNKTARTHFRTLYDDETKIIVGEWFREDISRFGYSF